MDSDDDESVVEEPTPSKTPLNKVKSGRVTKSQGSGRGGQPRKSYAESVTDEDDEILTKPDPDEEDEELAVHTGNGHHNGKRYGHKITGEQDEYYDAANEEYEDADAEM